jgi:F-type H+-transporting ATPase subunit gamma
MASLRDIRKRIKSVQNTEKITRAMKMVSAAKLRRAQENVEAARPYADKVLETVSALAKRAENMGEAPHPLLARKPEKKRIELIVMTSDRGLCGAFNSNTIRRAQRFHFDHKDTHELSISTIGRKGAEALRRDRIDLRSNYEGVFESLNFHTASQIAEEMCQFYVDGELDGVYLLYNEFKSIVTQKLTLMEMLPVVPLEVEDELVDYEYEPGQDELLDGLLPQHFATTLYRALLESQASEHGARMNSMDNATKNAKEMVGKLKLHYNRARQAAITTELMEIIGGAEALK